MFASVGATIGVAIWQERRRRSGSSLARRNETDSESGSGPDERSLVNESDGTVESSGPQPPSLALHLEPVVNRSQQAEVELDNIDGNQGKLEPAHADTQPPPEHSAATGPSVNSPPMLRIAP
ncbi:hypothetical protein PG996_003370 [Apiospora saccharicola]|uniref:Uncharacterized protein n=1 Tax=Apiospora saccharicola TaxID=335842 RepID=A0ABR1W127_9PEZI